MNLAEGLNLSAQRGFANLVERARELRIQHRQLECGSQILDCGVQASGGLAAGLAFADICLAGLAKVQMGEGDRSVWSGPWIEVTTDHPLEACMFGQYAGWPVQHEGFFAMGSGPMRVKRGKEDLLTELAAKDGSEFAVGTLECDVLPNDKLAEGMAAECGVTADGLMLAVAPTRSIAGCVQVVARSVETAMHKLHELGFALSQVRSAYGSAPLPPPVPDFAAGIGRTNDAILYGAQVSLWVEGEDDQIAEVGRRLPSCSSSDFGRPFAEIFARYNHDFYQIDPGLFSPAEVLLMNLKTGTSWRFGDLRPDLIQQSFATQ